MALNFDDDFYQQEIKEILKTRPLSLLAGDKLNRIIDVIKQYNCKNILEIGTFGGGTAYLLSKELPDCNVTTIDINQFEEYFKNSQNDHVFKSIKGWYPDIEIKTDSILKVQKIYQELDPSIVFIVGNLYDLKIKRYDFVIIDGDHSPYELIKNLNFIFYNIKKGIIVVDDCVYPHIQKICKKFCRGKQYWFDVYKDYGNVKGNDLCFILKEKKKVIKHKSI